MAAATTFALIAASIAAVGSISAGVDASNAADFQAATQRQQAIREREVAGQEEEDFRRDQSRRLASKRAALGASGIDPSTGTSLLAAKDFAAEAELQALRIRSGGATSATRLQQQATLTSAVGDAALTEGAFRAGSSLLTGFGQKFGTKTPTTTTKKTK